MGALSIKNVKKTYHSLEILKGINLEIEAGQFLILVGPSGCGKSTLLNMIAGLETVTSGEIHIGDRVVNDLNPKDRDIAMVFQSYALYPNMTVRRNISFGLEIRKVPASQQDEIVKKVANTLQITHLLDRKPSQLSGGQRQRVAMGRALARNPTLYLFDEPLSNLDAKLRVEMRTEMKLLHERMKTTIVYVTHDQIEAMTLGDRIAIMQGGEIQQFGSPEEVYNNPTNMFVAGFIGSPSMNFVPTPVVASDGEVGVQLTNAHGETFVLPAPTGQAALKPYVGKEVMLGIRPEKVTEKVPAMMNQPHIHVARNSIEVTEPTGPDTLVFVNFNGAEMVCRISPEIKPKRQDRMELMFDMSKAVFFDSQTQTRIA